MNNVNGFKTCENGVGVCIKASKGNRSCRGGGIDTASLISSQAAFESIPVRTTLHESSFINEICLRYRAQEYFHLLLRQARTAGWPGLGRFAKPRGLVQSDSSPGDPADSIRR